MRHFIKSHLNIKKLSANSLVQNFFFLGGVQSFHLLVPLVLTPYLVKTVGISNFGKIVFCQSVVNFLNILTDYGFTLNSSRTISVYRNDIEKRNSIYSTTLISKTFLLCVTFVILNLLFFIPLFAENKTILLFSFFMCVGQIITPAWAFQGIEKMKMFAVINVVFKILYAIAVLLLVKHPGDYINVNLFLGISTILAGICSMWVLKKTYKFSLSFIPFRDIRTALKESFYYFISSFSSNVYAYSNSIILGIFVSYEGVGIYGIVEKTMQVSKQVLTIYMQIVHPAACLIVARSYTEYKRFIKKAYLPFLLLYIVFCIGLFIFAGPVAKFFNATDVTVVANYIRIIVFALLASCLNIPANLSLLALHFPKSYSLVFITVSAASILLNILLVSVWGLAGCIYNILITEILIAAGLHLILQFRHKQYALFNI